MAETKDKVIQKSIYWSGLGEIGAKLIVPISTMILARILKPDDFGVIAICNMLVFLQTLLLMRDSESILFKLILRMKKKRIVLRM